MPMRTPAIAPSMPARPNANWRISVTLMPICAAASGSCAVARSALPIQVLDRKTTRPPITATETTMIVMSMPVR